ncbi:MAG: winged helix-turn-helix domain-containing protein [Sphingomonadales bacterium]|nr:winged helix-turn-helix domain-containing protein [Sphingomonadales bacterium]MDE2169746.1 winged helix-turn-helix domain-containing protein [Sphingomonadales bacterium]
MIFQFETFALDTTLRELRRDGVLIALEPQVFDLLHYLVEARDRVVTRDDLIETVWQGRIVSDATLSSRINAARVALGDSGAQQRLIRTLPRKGVRFVGTVADNEPAPPPPQRRGTPCLPALAVLPFVNMSGDAAQDYFADGMAEEIITALSRISGIFVIARNSSFTYKGRATDVRQIGQDLGVGYVLEGSVRRGADRLRIAAQLIEAASGGHLWSDRFDGHIDEVFDLQERVAASVAAAIEPTLQIAEIARLERAAPMRMEAYDLLLRGWALMAGFTAESMTEALTCFEAALALDPTYAPALASSSYGHAQQQFQGWVRLEKTTCADVVAMAWRAAELAPGDGQVLWMAAFTIWTLGWGAGELGHERARDLFARSLLVNPNSALALTLAGWIEIMNGRVVEGRAMVERAQRLSPLDPRGWLADGVLALACVIEEDYAAALRWAEKSLAHNRRFAVALRVAAVAYVKLGQMDRARRVVGDLLEIEAELTISGLFERIPFPLDRMKQTYAEALSAAGLPA